MAKPIPTYEPLITAIQLASCKLLHNQERDIQTEWMKPKDAKRMKKEKGKYPKSGGVDPFIKDLKLDLDRPLKHALRSIFQHNGKVVLAFPGSSYKQVIVNINT